jgi:hypothetical protein
MCYRSGMETPAFTTDKTVKRLRWVMLGVILFDLGSTLLGQPGSYWQHPETADEGNRLFRFFMVLGPLPYFSFDLVYLAVAFLVASMACRRGALIGIFSYILGHYYGASSWLANHWHLGAASFIVYGMVLACVLVSLAFPACGRASPGLRME